MKYTTSIQLLFLNLVSISVKLEFDNFVKGPTFENIFDAENFGISIWRGAIIPPIEAPNGGYVCYEIRIRDLDLAKCVHGQCVWVWVICEFVWGDMGTKLVLVQEGD